MRLLNTLCSVCLLYVLIARDPTKTERITHDRMHTLCVKDNASMCAHDVSRSRALKPRGSWVLDVVLYGLWRCLQLQLQLKPRGAALSPEPLLSASTAPTAA